MLSSRTPPSARKKLPRNAELELQTTKDTTEGRPKPMGKRGAFVADHVAGGPDGDKRPVSPVTSTQQQLSQAVPDRGSARSESSLTCVPLPMFALGH